MIVSFFLYVAGIVLAIIGAPLAALTSLFTVLVPEFVTEALASFYGTIAIFQGILPLVATDGAPGIAGTVGILDIFDYVVVVVTAMFTLYMIYTIVRIIPFLSMRTPQDK